MNVLEPVVLVAAINIVVEIVKRTGIVTNRFLPLTALALGLVFGLATSWPFYIFGIVNGILYAGTAMGLYRGTKVVLNGN